MPADLSIASASGLISGTILSSGTSIIELGATNAVGTGTATLTLSAYSVPVITSATTATALVDEPFSYTLTATGEPTTFAATGLPSGLSFDSETREISGTPTVTGTSNITLTASNLVGSDTKTLELTVYSLAPAITSELVVTGTLGQPFDYQITATNTPTSFAAEPLPEGFPSTPAVASPARSPPPRHPCHAHREQQLRRRHCHARDLHHRPCRGGHARLDRLR
ncbi:putative Ig domain-containing protein [Ereboglobus luteus]|uniref:putative Ig domain-containing protein n=1 Tax=Ereboglobus luteus TaxID=1796921 RepID=UPI0013752292|nr:putative Ig domain-containing protein [Ereboglobus luteus]